MPKLCQEKKAIGFVKEPGVVVGEDKKATILKEFGNNLSD